MKRVLLTLAMFATLIVGNAMTASNAEARQPGLRGGTYGGNSYRGNDGYYGGNYVPRYYGNTYYRPYYAPYVYPRNLPISDVLRQIVLRLPRL